MNDTKTADTRHPNSARLREKFHDLKQDGGLEDIKFWYAGPTVFAGSEDSTTVDDLSIEVLTILEAYEKGDFVDISEKLK